MAIRILLLGPLQDIAGYEAMEVSGPLDWQGLLTCAGPGLAAQIANERVKLACRGIVLADKTALQAEDGDEIALLPPVSGG